MKKIIILLAIVSLITTANAAWEILVDGQAMSEVTIAPSDNLTISISTDVAGNSLTYLDVFDAGGGISLFTLSNPQAGPALGDFPGQITGPYDSSENGDPVNDYLEVEIIQAWQPTTDPQAGVVFIHDVHCEGIGDVIYELYDDAVGYDSPVAALTIHQTPEPMTLSLIGLGGLLLRRRKK